jgi:hypothetical protein
MVLVELARPRLVKLFALTGALASKVSGIE